MIIKLDNNKVLTDDESKKQLFNFLKNNKSIKLNMIDKTRGFYVRFEYKKQRVNIPFKYLLTNTNKKLNGIHYINFEIECSSKNKGYCNICKYCYSILGQNLFKNNNHKICLNVLFIRYVINEYYNNNLKPFKLIIDYLNNVPLVRFNCNNDFNNIRDLKFLINLAEQLPDTILYGYTKRLDLKDSIESLDVPKNLIINSNYKELSKKGSLYITTYNIQEYILNNYTCKGECINCLKCTKKTNKTIYCLLHGPKNKIDPVFNTKNNREYLIKFFNQNNINLKEQDLTTNKGLLSSLNKYLRSNNHNNLQFKNIKELTDYIKSVGGVQYESKNK